MIFQLDSATNKLVDFGIIGVVLIFVAFMAYKMWIKINEDQIIWRNEAIQSRQDLTGLMQKQNEINQDLISIRREDVNQNKENFHDIKENLKEINRSTNEIKMNLTSARNK